MRNAGRVLGALLCTAALAGSALALRVVPGGRVLALLFCSPGAAFTLWQLSLIHISEPTRPY